MTRSEIAFDTYKPDSLKKQQTNKQTNKQTKQQQQQEKKGSKVKITSDIKLVTTQTAIKFLWVGFCPVNKDWFDIVSGRKTLEYNKDSPKVIIV